MPLMVQREFVIGILSGIFARKNGEISVRSLVVK